MRALGRCVASNSAMLRTGARCCSGTWEPRRCGQPPGSSTGQGTAVACGAPADSHKERAMTSPPRIQGVQEWLYVVIVASLALYLVIGVVAWT